MDISIYKVDAFTDKLFTGNYAAVCPLEDWLKEEQLLQIAQENNLPETVFYIKKDGEYHIRWFTPEIEMDLCGHATLAAAHVIFENENHKGETIPFHSASGQLVARKSKEWIILDFPSRIPQACPLPDIILEGIGQAPIETLRARDYILVYESEEDISKLQPKQSILNQINLDPGGIIVTAKGNDDVDFVSRFFTPQASIFEDPVTGSAHCSLIPFWAERLGKQKMLARQLSQRQGLLQCENKADRVLIGGQSITYLKGKIVIR